VFFSSSNRAAGSTASRRRLASLFGALLAAAIITTAVTPAAHADSYCPTGNVCLWDAANFSQRKSVYGAAWAQTSYWIPLGTIKNSVQNRFADRAVWTIFYRDGYYHRWDCLDPNGYRLGDGYYRANYLWVGPTGSRC
jgi:hypothetical protein